MSGKGERWTIKRKVGYPHTLLCGVQGPETDWREVVDASRLEAAESERDGFRQQLIETRQALRESQRGEQIEGSNDG